MTEEERRKVEAILASVTDEDREQLWGRVLLGKIEAWLVSYAPLGTARLIQYIEGIRAASRRVVAGLGENHEKFQQFKEEAKTNLMYNDSAPILLDCYREANNAEDVIRLLGKLEQLAGKIAQNICQECAS